MVRSTTTRREEDNTYVTSYPIIGSPEVGIFIRSNSSNAMQVSSTLEIA